MTAWSGVGVSVGWEHGHDAGHLFSPSEECCSAFVGEREHGSWCPLAVGLLHGHIPGGFELGHVTSQVSSGHAGLVLEVDEVGLFEDDEMG